MNTRCLGEGKGADHVNGFYGRGRDDTSQSATKELFTNVDAHRSDPPVYHLVDWHGEKLDGTFYEPELQKVIVRRARRIELSPSYAVVTREGKFW